jgi:hypothetical protein
MRLPDLAAGQSSGMTWYYAAAPVAALNSVVAQVQQSVVAAAAAAAAPTPTPPPTPITTFTPEAAPTIRPPLDAAVRTAQQAGPVQRASGSESPLFAMSGPVPTASSDDRTMGPIGGMEVVHLRSGDTSGENARAGSQALGDLKMFVVDGGLRLTAANRLQQQ